MADRPGTGVYRDGTMPFLYQVGGGRSVVVEVPIDLTPDEEVLFKRLLNAATFGTLVESIADERARYPHKFEGAPDGPRSPSVPPSG